MMRSVHVSGGSRPTGKGHDRFVWTMRAVLPLVGLLSLLVAACGPSTQQAAYATDQTFTWPFAAPGVSSVADEAFDPAQVASAYDMGSAQMIYSGLVTLAPDLTVQPDDAKHWDVSADGKTYTFHLLPGLKFSDGTPIDSSTFAYSLDRLLNPCTQAYGAYYMYEIKDAATFNNEVCAHGVLSAGNDQSGPVITSLVGRSLATPDKQTLVITLDQPYAYFLEALTYPASYPVEKSLVDKYPDGSWVRHLDAGGCSGPFKIASYGDGKMVTYVPNPYWASAHNQHLTLTKVIRPYVSSQDTEYANYRTNAQVLGKYVYDYTDVPGSDYPYARGQDDFHEVTGLEIQYFGFNFLTAPFDNLQVRQAFDLALNKQLMADRICQGGCVPTNHIVPQGQPGYNPDLVNPPADGTQSLTGNQTAAQSLLQQAVQQCHGPSTLNYYGYTNAPTDPDWCPYVDAKHYGTALKEIDVYVAGKSDSETRVLFTKAAAQQWSDVFGSMGLNIQVKRLDIAFNSYYKNVAAGDYGAFALGWLADYPDPQDWLSLQFMSNSSLNYEHLTNHDLDALMTKADLTQLDANHTQATRMKEYHQIEQQIVNSVAWIPYEQGKITWRLRDWVHGFSLNSEGSFPDTSWPQVYITQH